MMKIVKPLLGFLFSAVAPVILVVSGALMMAGGAYLDWSWLITGGLFTAIFGVVPMLGFFSE